MARWLWTSATSCTVPSLGHVAAQDTLSEPLPIPAHKRKQRRDKEVETIQVGKYVLHGDWRGCGLTHYTMIWYNRGPNTQSIAPVMLYTAHSVLNTYKVSHILNTLCQLSPANKHDIQQVYRTWATVVQAQRQYPPWLSPVFGSRCTWRIHWVPLRGPGTPVGQCRRLTVSAEEIPRLLAGLDWTGEDPQGQENDCQFYLHIEESMVIESFTILNC